MSVQTDARVTVRVDRDLKEQAEILFERLGLNMSTALNVFLRKSVDEGAIPFPVSAKNSSFERTQTQSDITASFEASVQNELLEHRQKGLPVARYDKQSKQAYLEFSDGTREYVQ